MGSHTTARPTDLQGISLNYTLSPPDGVNLWTSIVRPTPPTPWTNVVNDPRDVIIHDARGRQHEFALDSAGFEFLTYPSAVSDLFDEEFIVKRYYPEIQQMLLKHTGAQRVVIAGHMHRRSHAGVHKITEFTDVTGPAFSVHGDRTLDAAESLAAIGLDHLTHGRYRIINVWRPIGNPARDVPLAMLDYRSIDQDRDLVPVTIEYATQHIETLAAFYSDKHRWFYLRDQTPQEIILMKNFDSLTDGTARVCMHSAFRDPTCSPDAQPRRSIEVRAYIFG
ncbi:hypothetical protein EYR40_010491 [Pleurotus pulmonarius]|nr:hypothetical protein EYR36_010123 [Pleurotus pulmonarius]KAF4588936.1 hypothetical protein EYR40_010491 [Pleurotus pulmonarius]